MDLAMQNYCSCLTVTVEDKHFMALCFTDVSKKYAISKMRGLLVMWKVVLRPNSPFCGVCFLQLFYLTFKQFA